MSHRNQDRTIFEERLGFLRNRTLSAEPLDHVIADIGNVFLGTPYGTGLLEVKGPERLVVNLRRFDCFTFVEHVIALACLKGSKEKSFEAFQKMLQKIRYRGGRVQGFASRLHYFSDWMHDNQKKHIVRVVTKEIGGKPFRKVLDFMTTHADRYPPLKRAATLRRMEFVERTISRRSSYFIPKNTLRHSEGQIHEGDLIAITTTIEGLDIQHVGFAATIRNRIHLLHASSAEGQVVLSNQTLNRYLMQSKLRSGIMVARLVGGMDP